ncbi:MAG: hypothetical protein M3Y13_13945 [Armatimonadota bacterium]|nr:hypothetical protein [Armatimonadota bacterium]
MSIAYNAPGSGGNPYAPPPQITFDWFGRAWALFKARPGLWIGLGLVFVVLDALLWLAAAVTTGYYADLAATISRLQAAFSGHLAAPPPGGPFANYGHALLFGVIFATLNAVFLGGLYRTAIRHARGEAIGIGDFFGAFPQALSLMGAGLLTYIAVLIGTYLCFFPGIVMGGLFMFAPLLIVDRKMGAIQALSESIKLLKSQWLMAALFYFVAQFVAGSGLFLCGVGLLATYPIFALSIAVGYLTFTEPQPLLQPQYGQPAPGVWPPPPTNPAG